MRNIRKNCCRITLILLCIMSMTGCNSEKRDSEVTFNPETPTVITVWHYYKGVQQLSFEALVNEFNDTEGKEKGIIVETYSQGNVENLVSVVLDSANKKVGASEMPDIFSAYADTAYTIDEMGLVADLNELMTEEELSKYITGYLNEGKFGDKDEYKIFPVAKATEILILNETAWDKFARATGEDKSCFETIEGITEAAEKYYNWTDSLTEEPYDGKAMFGRDAIANLFFIGAKQLGLDLVESDNGKARVQFEEDVIRKIWDNFYIPYVKGYFYKAGRFSSDDMRTDDIISYIGSSSSVAYAPREVTTSGNITYPIDIEVFKAPKFKDGGDYCVQQGAGMVVTNTNKNNMYASVEFLKWMSDSERNIKFASASGYLPVTYEANNEEMFNKFSDIDDIVVLEAMSKSIETINSNELYTPKAVKGGSEIRYILENRLLVKAIDDRNKVVKMMKEGIPRDEALEEFLSDECFKKWFNSTKIELEKEAKK